MEGVLTWLLVLTFALSCLPSGVAHTIGTSAWIKRSWDIDWTFSDQGMNLKRYRSLLTLKARKLHNLLTREEVYWKQRSKQHWLLAGDGNTRFFHQYASWRRKKNCIMSLCKNDGTWVEGDQLHGAILDYFKDIFSSSYDSQHCTVFHPSNCRTEWWSTATFLQARNPLGSFCNESG